MLGFGFLIYCDACAHSVSMCGPLTDANDSLMSTISENDTSTKAKTEIVLTSSLLWCHC